MFSTWLHFACNLNLTGRLHVSTLVCFGPWARHLTYGSPNIGMFMTFGRLCMNIVLFLGQDYSKYIGLKDNRFHFYFQVRKMSAQQPRRSPTSRINSKCVFYYFIHCILLLMCLLSKFRWGRSQPSSRVDLLEEQGKLERARINGRWILNCMVP